MNHSRLLLQDFDYTYSKDLLIGFALAVIVCGVVSVSPLEYAVDFFATFLALTAKGYFGSALAEGKVNVFAIESLVSLVVYATALGGLWHSPVWLAVGYLAHGVWNFFHHPHRCGARVTMSWFPPACLSYDWTVALYILLHVS